MNQFKYISANPDILGGKPCITGTRISVDMVLEWLSSGASVNDIVGAYPHLNVEKVTEAIQYAARFMQNEIVIEVQRVA
jgi:uncharacterized protein (DUF433 family)